MSKGERTREAILAEATQLASVAGLEGLTIGGLARHAGMSKSGLFAHFGSREALQLAVLEAASRQFTRAVITPARRHQRGIDRLSALIDGWLHWDGGDMLRGGCVFIGAAMELDDRPGPARDYTVAALRLWHRILAGAVARAIREGDLSGDLDPDEVAHDLYATMLGFHVSKRLMHDPGAVDRARRSFVRLLGKALPARAA